MVAENFLTVGTTVTDDAPTMLLGFIGGIGAAELTLILLLVLVLFGARKIPELAKGLGSGLREFKKAASEVKSAADVNVDVDVDDKNSERLTTTSAPLSSAISSTTSPSSTTAPSALMNADAASVEERQSSSDNNQ